MGCGASRSDTSPAQPQVASGAKPAGPSDVQPAVSQKPATAEIPIQAAAEPTPVAVAEEPAPPDPPLQQQSQPVEAGASMHQQSQTVEARAPPQQQSQPVEAGASAMSDPGEQVSEQGVPQSSQPAPVEGTAQECQQAQAPEQSEAEAEDEPPYKPMAPLLAQGQPGDVRYRLARIKSRSQEPLKTPSLPAEEEAELKRVWQEEWFGFPQWNVVALARVAVGSRKWSQMSNDRRRAAVERFALCGPWAASQEPDAAALARMRVTSSSPTFVKLMHPARREAFVGAFCAAHGLARVVQLKSDRPSNPSYYDEHTTTERGSTMTTAEVCYKIVVPATRAFGASYADLFLGPELWGDKDAQGLQGAARRRFLSHAWGMPFMEMISVSIIDGSPPRHDEGPFWIDIFCKNQHVPIKESDLTDNILGSEGVTLAVYPWPAPLLTTRVWCLFEVLTANQTKVPMRLKFCPGASDSLYGVMRGKYSQWSYSVVRKDAQEKGLSAVLPGASELVETIDVRQAVATVAADKDMIMGLIDRGPGAEAMNTLVRRMLTEGLTDALETVVEAMANEGRTDYYSYEPGCD